MVMVIVHHSKYKSDLIGNVAADGPVKGVKAAIPLILIRLGSVKVVFSGRGRGIIFWGVGVGTIFPPPPPPPPPFHFPRKTDLISM